MRQATGVLCTAILFAPISASAKNYDLAPTSPWNMHYADDGCSLRRSFGSDDERVLLEMARFAPRTAFDIRLFSKIIRKATLSTNVSMTFGDSRNTTTLPAMPGALGDLPALFFRGWIGIPTPTDNAVAREGAELPPAMELDAAEDSVQSASFQLQGKRINLQLGPMTGAMKAMRKCTADLVRSWGLDPHVQERLQAGPVPKSGPGRWLSSEDYPSDSFMRGEQAIIKFRLLVDAAGHPTQCVIQQSIAKTKDFSETTCKGIMRRARFEPARGPDGASVASYYINTVIFMMDG